MKFIFIYRIIHYLCEKLNDMQTDTITQNEVDYSLLDFRKSEQYISKPQPNDDNDDYEDTDN